MNDNSSSALCSPFSWQPRSSKGNIIMSHPVGNIEEFYNMYIGQVKMPLFAVQIPCHHAKQTFEHRATNFPPTVPTSLLFHDGTGI
jgi:hypothetical protein